MEDKKYLTVTALTKYLKMKFERDIHLQQVYLKGEISNFKAHTRGHFYFTLKDENTRINAVMFANSNKSLNFLPKDGMKVLVCGRVDLYESTGSYQIYCDELIEDGVGNLYIAYEQLKQKLLAEGLFDPIYKKPIPKIPKRVGIITAPTGAAIRDILTTIERRFPLCETILFPALVQGEYAPKSIVQAILKAQEYDIDTLIVGRGGGSIEDLWAFNDELVARTIFQCPIPIISAVGHEVDFTISDFVADLRAATPTGAAEIVVPNVVNVQEQIKQFEIRMSQSIQKSLELKRERLNTLTSSYILKNPMKIYEQKEQQLDNLIERLTSNMNQLISQKRYTFDSIQTRLNSINPLLLVEQKRIQSNYLYERLNISMERIIKHNRHQFENTVTKLDALSPLKIMQRGFSIIKNEQNEIVTSIHDVKKLSMLTISLKDGVIQSQVIDIMEGQNGN